MAPRIDVRGNAYSAVQGSKRIPRVLARLIDHPTGANASRTGAGFMNLKMPSGIRKTTTSPLRMRPAHTPFFDDEVRAEACASSAAWLQDDIFLLFPLNAVEPSAFR